MNQQISHAQFTYELRNGPGPSHAQLDGTEPEFEIRRARRVVMPRELARLVVVPPRHVGDCNRVQGCQDDAGTR